LKKKEAVELTRARKRIGVTIQRKRKGKGDEVIREDGEEEKPEKRAISGALAPKEVKSGVVGASKMRTKPESEPCKRKAHPEVQGKKRKVYIKRGRSPDPELT